MSSNFDKLISVFLILFSGFLWRSLEDVPAHVAYYPKALILCLAVCSLMLLIKPFLTRSSVKISASDRSGFVYRRPAVELVGLSFIYLCVLPYLGFIAASVIFLGVLMWRLGVRHWLPLAGVSTATVALIYLGFERGLMVPLPDGYSVWSLFY